MDAASDSQALHDLDALDVESLKALILTQRTEIENLNLLVLKLKRMHFGQRSEKLNADIEQLELRLEDLEEDQAANEPQPAQAATAAVRNKSKKK